MPSSSVEPNLYHRMASLGHNELISTLLPSVKLHGQETCFFCFLLIFCMPYQNEMFNLWVTVTVSTFIHLPGMFLSLDIHFEHQIGQFTMGLLYIKFTYYIHVLWIISRSVPVLATDSPCSVWGPGWTTCHLYGGPLLGLCFWNDGWCVSLL